MNKITKLLSLIVTVSPVLVAATTSPAFAGKTSDSYYVSLFKKYDLNPKICRPVPVEPDDGIHQDAICSLGAPAAQLGYELRIVADDHAQVPLLIYRNAEISWETLYADFKPGSGATHFYGLEGGNVEVRYKLGTGSHRGTKTPYALIIRMSTSRAVLTPDGDVIFKGTDEELLVFHLNGEKSKLIGKVNARTQKANEKARVLADRLK